ncbi:MAG: hypothetical protein NVS4B10_07050 [Myxococcales bacterium]
METWNHSGRRQALIAFLCCALATTVADAAPDEGKAAPAEAAPAEAAPNPQMKAVLDQLGTMHGKPIDKLSAKEARKQPSPADAVKALLKGQGKSVEPEPVGKVQDIRVAGAKGTIPARVYWPAGAGPFPVVVYFHGGGWVIADLDTYDASPRALVNLANAIVVSVAYRQGPENRFPAAHEDSFAAYKWTLAHAASLKGDPARVAVVGESAGGNLAAAVAMMARDRKVQAPLAMGLVYPIAGADFDTESYRENARAKPLNKPMMQWFYKNYLRSAKDAQDPRISLVKADLAGLPPATIVTAQIDPLRSEGKELADQLQKAGVAVDYKNYEGVTHEFFGMAAAVDEAKAAEAQIAAGLTKAFKR